MSQYWDDDHDATATRLRQERLTGMVQRDAVAFRAALGRSQAAREAARLAVERYEARREWARLRAVTLGVEDEDQDGRLSG